MYASFRPRLQSLLDARLEDRPRPNSFLEIRRCKQGAPHTNPINLVFVLTRMQLARMTVLHFPTGLEFPDLIAESAFSGASRARAFLWIMWHYLESDFTEEGCDENPFGHGVDYGTGVANEGVPRLEGTTVEARI